MSEFLKSRRVDLDPSEHRENAFPIVIVHLDFSDVRVHPGHRVNDRVRQPAVIGTNGSYYDLHDEAGSREQGVRSRLRQSMGNSVLRLSASLIEGDFSRHGPHGNVPVVVSTSGIAGAVGCRDMGWSLP